MRASQHYCHRSTYGAGHADPMRSKGQECFVVSSTLFHLFDQTYALSLNILGTRASLPSCAPAC